MSLVSFTTLHLVFFFVPRHPPFKYLGPGLYQNTILSHSLSSLIDGKADIFSTNSLTPDSKAGYGGPRLCLQRAHIISPLLTSSLIQDIQKIWLQQETA